MFGEDALKLNPKGLDEKARLGRDLACSKHGGGPIWGPYVRDPVVLCPY